jgi:CheY-like chemotaxis protein
MEPRTDQQSGPRWILVVDGDVQTQRLLDLSLRNAGFEVKTVANVPEATAWLAGQRPDLVICETRLDGGTDGFDFCRAIKKRPDGASIAFVFLAEVSVEARVKGIEAGAEDFLAKPPYMQEVVARARSLMQRRERDRLDALAHGDERFAGDIDDLPLVDLLRAIEASRKSGVIVMAGAGGGRGEIYFRDGVVVDAEVGRLSGLEAVCRLFSWTHGRFEIDWKSIRRKDAVATEPSALLMEALRRLEEWRRLLAEVPPLDTVFEVDYHLLAERLAEIPDEVNATLRLFDGQRTFIQVIDDCGLSDLDALAVIGKLFREQIIRDVRMRPEPVSSPGADIEGWLTDATGPFRAPTSRLRRELFGASIEASAGVHGRATAPVEPLEEAGREAIVDERRERFTDRLIAESAAPEGPKPPAPAPPPTAAPPPPRVPALLAAETTQQGLGMPVPALSTRPGFAAVTPPAPRVARSMPTDVTPTTRGAPLRAGVVSIDGVPEPLPPQSPSPAIVVPDAVNPKASPPSTALAVNPPEQRPVAGEIQSRASTSRLVELEAYVVEAAQKRAAGKRVTERRAVEKTPTDPGPGPRTTATRAVEPGPRTTATRAVEPGPRTTATRAVVAGAPSSVAGEVFASGRKTGNARPIRKIILDPEIPEDDDDQRKGAGWAKGLFIGVILALGFAGAWFSIAKTGRRHGEPTAGAAGAGEVNDTRVGASGVQAVDEGVHKGRGVATSSDAGAGDAGAAKALADSPAGHGVRPILDERAADPKWMRELPAQFPQLLAGCRQAFTEKRAKDAETACLAAKDANPDSAEACALLGHALLNRKKRVPALQWAERAVALDPKQADAYVIIGGVEQAQGDATAAKAAYKKYLDLAPNGQYAADLRAIVEAPSGTP